MNILESYRWNAKLRRQLREHSSVSREITAELISPAAEWVPSVDTAHYSVRRYDAVLSRYVYAPWNWGADGASQVFACDMVRMSDGISTDPFADEHCATMREAHAPQGSYHFFRDNANAIEQERVFSAKAEACGGYGFAVAIDCETLTGSHANYISRLGSFVNELRKHYDGLLMAYSRASFWDAIWLGADSPGWTRELSQWQAIYPSALKTDAAKRAILYDGFIPAFPAAKMKGLGERVGWQFSALINNYLIPGHNMVKAAEDGNLWLRSTLPVPVPPPMTLEEQVADHERRITRLEQVAGI